MPRKCFLSFASLLLLMLCAALTGCGPKGMKSPDDWHRLAKELPPPQSETGPGGKDYPHDSVQVHAADDAEDGYTLFEPDEPRPQSADVVVFNHGLAQVNPKMYGGWIRHLVRKGNIVIYPRFEVPGTLSSKFNENAAAGILKALEELKNGNHVKPRLENFAIIGHSYGGVLSANLAVEYEKYRLPKAKALMVAQGWDGLDMRLKQGYSGLPSDTRMLVVTGQLDFVVGQGFAKRLMKETRLQPGYKNMVTHLPDAHNLLAPLAAGHDEPLSVYEPFDNQEITPLILISLPLARENAVDYFCYWKLSEALLNCSFYGQNCNYAFGNTPEQRSMGKWGDGTAARELKVRLR